MFNNITMLAAVKTVYTMIFMLVSSDLFFILKVSKFNNIPPR